MSWGTYRTLVPEPQAGKPSGAGAGLQHAVSEQVGCIGKFPGARMAWGDRKWSPDVSDDTGSGSPLHACMLAIAPGHGPCEAANTHFQTCNLGPNLNPTM